MPSRTYLEVDPTAATVGAKCARECTPRFVLFFAPHRARRAAVYITSSLFECGILITSATLADDALRFVDPKSYDTRLYSISSDGEDMIRVMYANNTRLPFRLKLCDARIDFSTLSEPRLR
jgi:hypothetical protein